MKLKIYSVFALLSTLLLTKGPSFTISYTDDDPFVVNLTKPSLKVVQFADLHLTYGFDKLDKLTYKLINDIVKETTPDLVVFTGDQTLSITAPSRYKQDLWNHLIPHGPLSLVITTMISILLIEYLARYLGSTLKT